MQRIDRRAVLRLVAVAAASLALATLAISLLEAAGLRTPPPSISRRSSRRRSSPGRWGAVIAAVAAFLLYDFLFVDAALHASPSTNPGEWLNLVLLLFIGIVVGQLVALQRSRTEIANAREREARALFGVSRALATRASTPAVLPTHRRASCGRDRDGSRLGRPRRRRRPASASRPTPSPTDGPRPPARTTSCSGRPTRRRPGGAGCTCRRRLGRAGTGAGVEAVPGPDRGRRRVVRVDLGGHGTADRR